MTWNALISGERPFRAEPDQSSFIRVKICPNAIGLQLRDTKVGGCEGFQESWTADDNGIDTTIYSPKCEPALSVAQAQIQAIKHAIAPTSSGNVMSITGGRCTCIGTDHNGLELLAFLDTTFGLRIRKREAREMGKFSLQYLHKSLRLTTYHSDLIKASIDVHTELIALWKCRWCNHIDRGRHGDGLHYGKCPVSRH